jgi:uncharacterized protein YbjT (DUF2867 family)
MDRRPVLLTGATGYVGSRLLPQLLERGHPVRAVVRDPSRARLPGAVEVHRGDLLQGGAPLAAALEGVGTAYYLVHSMGRGARDEHDFAARDRQAAVNFAELARDAGVRRVVYLGGLGPTDAASSEHLASRHEVAVQLGLRVPIVYVRAAMIIGAGSASFRILRHLTERLPVMITPRWLETRSQPVAIRDVVRTLADVGEHPDPPAELQLGGADVLSYREMVNRLAAVLGRRRPLTVPVPVLTPRLSSYWIALVTPVETGLIRPLVDGLRYETVVEEPPPDGLNDDPLGFDDAAREALT